MRNLAGNRRFHRAASKYRIESIELPGTRRIHRDASKYRQESIDPAGIHRAASKYRLGEHESIDLAALDDAATPESQKELYSTLIKRCGRSKNLAAGRRIHDRLARNPPVDRFLANLLVEMYGKCGSVGDAKRIFDAIERKNVYSWTIMIAAAASNGSKALAMEIFGEMDLDGVRPNQITFVVALEACSSIVQGRHLYHCIVDDGTLGRDRILGNAVITMFGRFQQLGDANAVFERVRGEGDVVTWNAIIAAFAQNGHFDKALSLFQSMDLEPDAVTYLSLVSVVEILTHGRMIHKKILENKAIHLENETNLSNALITMYGRFNCLDDARKCFSSLQNRDVVSWNAVLAANAQSGNYASVLDLYKAMDVEPDQRTFLAALDACANLTAIRQGREVHSRISRHHNLVKDALVGNSLVYMYAKFGSVEDAKLAFIKIENKDVISWTAIIAAHCQNGYAIESLELFLEMQQQGIKPDPITYGCVLSACSYAGLVYNARDHFVGISSNYDLAPNADNFCTMVDVLSRSGWLEPAEELIETMPFLPDPVTWTMLLGACKVYGDVERAKRISKLRPRDQSHSGDHVLLSNLFAAAKKWDDVKITRKRMEKTGLRKLPGRSWIEVDGKVHEFFVGDASHEQWDEIQAKLLELNDAISKEGYVPSTEEVLHDIEDSSKCRLLAFHSEKVAMAFGLLSTPEGTPLRVMKNLRMCYDCHAAAKLISKVTRREIIVRDANRFHRFRSGECTCKDFW